jgi:hypothetical protein
MDVFLWLCYTSVRFSDYKIFILKLNNVNTLKNNQLLPNLLKLAKEFIYLTKDIAKEHGESYINIMDIFLDINLAIHSTELYALKTSRIQ